MTNTVTIKITEAEIQKFENLLDDFNVAIKQIESGQPIPRAHSFWRSEMANTITIEMNETEAQKFENLLDETLAALRQLEEQSPARDARMEQKQIKTDRTLAEIENRLNVIAELDNQRRRFTTDLS